MTLPTDKLLTIKEAAKYLGVTPNTLRRWEGSGYLIPQRTAGNQRRYTAEDVLNIKHSKPKYTHSIRVSKNAASKSQFPIFNFKSNSNVQNSNFQNSSFQPQYPNSNFPLLASQPRSVEYAGPQAPITNEPIIKFQVQIGKFEAPKYLKNLNYKFANSRFVNSHISIPSLLIVVFLALVLSHSSLADLASFSNFNSLISELRTMPKPVQKPPPKNLVLAAQTAQNSMLKINIPANFAEKVVFMGDAEFQGLVTGGIANFSKSVTTDTLTANNVIYSVKAGPGISISTGQNPTITNTGLTSLTAGSGISVSGSTVTNSDTGSGQKMFKTIAVSGQTSISASTNTDILTLIDSSGLTWTTDATNKQLTATVDTTLGGWTDNGSIVRLTTTTDKVGIGTSNPIYKLDLIGSLGVSGTAYFASNVGIGTSNPEYALDVNGSIRVIGASIMGGINNNNGGITNAGPITGATGLTSSGTITFSGLSTGVVHSDFSGILSSSAINLANNDVSGILPMTRGGTGLTSYLAGSILYASASGQLNSLGIGASGQVLTVSNGFPVWGAGGVGGACTDCVVTDPGSNQTITPTGSTATGLVVAQANGGSVDIFKVTSYGGGTNYLRVDSTGNVILGNGGLSAGTFTINPANTDPIAIIPVGQGSTAYTGTITSAVLTDNRTWTFPNSSGDVCLTTGNCAGSGSNLGGSGTNNYLTKWQSQYSFTNSILYDNGNIGIGNTNPSYKLEVTGTGYFSGNVGIGQSFAVTGPTDLSSTLSVIGPVDFNSTLGVNGETILSSTLGVTGLTTVGGAINVNGLGDSWIAGNIGVGTTAPAYKLEVIGTMGVSSSAYIGSSLSVGTTTPNYFFTLGNNAFGVSRTGVVGAGTWQGTVIDSQYGGTGQNSSTWTGVPYVASGIWNIDSNYLALTRGGTNANLSGLTQGSIIYKDATTLNGSGALTGIMQGNGSSAPTAITGTANYLPKWNTSSPYLSGISLIYDNGTNVGVGTSVPTYKLDVNGSFGVNGTAYFAANVGIGTTNPLSPLTINKDAGGNAAMTINQLGSGDIFSASSAGSPRFTIDNAGSVGIGTTLPAYQLDVRGANGYINALTGYCINGDCKTSWASVGTNYWQRNGSYVTPFNVGDYVGIGTTAPGAALEVNGQVKITGGTPGLNKVLTSDAAGLASWTSVTSAGGVGGTGIANYITYWSDPNNLTAEQYLSPARGGVGLSGSTASNGTLLIGNGSGYTLTTLTAGTGIGITNASGSITINNNAPWTDSSNSYIQNQYITAQSASLRISGAAGIGGSAYFLSNVGVGTSSPAYSLDVTGTLGVSSSAYFGNNIQLAGRLYDSTGFQGSVGQVLQSTGIGVTWVTNEVSGVTGTGTQNYITKFAGSTSLENSSLYETGGQIGIGNTNPTYKLDVTGSLGVSSSAYFANNVSLAGRVYDAANVAGNAGQVLQSTGVGTSWVNFTSMGVAGTGVTNYAAYWKDANTIASEEFLNVSRGGTGLSGASAGNGTLLIGNGSGYTLANLIVGTGIGITNASGAITLTNTAPWTDSSNSYIQNQTTVNQSASFQISGSGYLAGSLGIGYTSAGTAKVAINGNVGIGTTAPGYQLDVQGANGYVNSLNGYCINGDCKTSWASAGTNYWQLALGALAPAAITNDLLTGGNSTNSALVKLAGTSGTNSWINTGNFGVGTTNPTYKLDVTGSLGVSSSAYFANNVSLAGRVYDAANVAGNAGQVLQSTGVGTSWVNFTSMGVAGTGVANYATYWKDANTIASEQYLNVSRGGTGLSGASAGNGTLLIGNG
jgi:excisionase family DNA binding protein